MQTPDNLDAAKPLDYDPLEAAITVLGNVNLENPSARMDTEDAHNRVNLAIEYLKLARESSAAADAVGERQGRQPAQDHQSESEDAVPSDTFERSLMTTAAHRRRFKTLINSWWPPALRRALYSWQQTCDEQEMELAALRYVRDQAQASLDSFSRKPTEGHVRDTLGLAESLRRYREMRDGDPRPSFPRTSQGTHHV